MNPHVMGVGVANEAIDQNGANETLRNKVRIVAECCEELSEFCRSLRFPADAI